MQKQWWNDDRVGCRVGGGVAHLGPRGLKSTARVWPSGVAVVMLLLLACVASADSPPEGATLRARHVLFTFDPIAGAESYQLQVVEAEGSGDGSDAVVDMEISRPRRIAKSGLEFGKAYQWRFRGVDAQRVPGPWSPYRHFSIAELPAAVQDALSVTVHDAQRCQPGLTMFNQDDINGRLGGSYVVAVNQTGEVVWFWRRGVVDLRMLRNGNLLYWFAGQAEETTLDGSIVWSTAAFRRVHIDVHEIFEMPNGNIMYMELVFRDVEHQGQPQVWMGHVLTEITRTGELVWTWDTFDHLSTLDFDPCVMDIFSPYNGVADWLHTNGVVYDATDNSVYCSIRHLSRIVKIDYATGDIMWSIGADMPSGDVRFGHNLFGFQHAPEVLPNGHILLYNNGNRRDGFFCGPPDPYSTAIELAVDPEAPEPVRVVWEFFQGFFTISRGDADRLRNGNTLVVAGSSGQMFEVTPEKEVVWELTSPTVVYRAERIASLYPLRGDADGDDDVDLLDFADFQRCFHGAGQFAFHRNCLRQDFDEDGDVDLEDYSLFQAGFTGDGP